MPLCVGQSLHIIRKLAMAELHGVRATNREYAKPVDGNSHVVGPVLTVVERDGRKTLILQIVREMSDEDSS
jgi:hypothetical protein